MMAGLEMNNSLVSVLGEARWLDIREARAGNLPLPLTPTQTRGRTNYIIPCMEVLRSPADKHPQGPPTSTRASLFYHSDFVRI